MTMAPKDFSNKELIQELRSRGMHVMTREYHVKLHRRARQAIDAVMLLRDAIRTQSVWTGSTHAAMRETESYEHDRR